MCRLGLFEFALQGNLPKDFLFRKCPTGFCNFLNLIAPKTFLCCDSPILKMQLLCQFKFIFA